MKFVGYFVLFACFGVIVWIGVSFLTFFGEASDGVKTASIAAIVTVFTFLFGRYLEQRRDLRAKQNVEKIELYKRFYDLYFRIFSSHLKSNEEALDENSVARELVEFQRDLIMWGSDGVLKAFIDFRVQLTVFGEATKEPDADLVECLDPAIKSAANLLREMRRDLGYTFTSFSAKDLGILQFRQDDPEIVRLMSKLG